MHVEAKKNSLTVKHILLVDKAFFECPICSKSLDRYIQFVKDNHLGDRIVCIVCKLGDIREQSRKILILEKKIEGFLKTNEIPFPVLLDQSRLFDSFCEKCMIAILLLDGPNKRIDRLEFPLSQKAWEKIFNGALNE